MAELSEDTMRTIVCEEINGSAKISNIETRFDKLETRFDGLESTVNHQGVLLEDVQSKLGAVLEMLSNNLDVKTTVTGHGEKIEKIETDTRMLKSTVALHSRQLSAS